jgi:hypothetical protein
MEKKIGKYWFSFGRQYGFGVGFYFNRYSWSFNLGIWYFGVELEWHQR